MSIANAMASPQSSIQSAGRVERMPVSLQDRVLIGGLSALILVAPFEALDPILRLPGQALTSVELPLLLVVACGLAVCWSERVRLWHSPFTGPWAAVLAVSLLAAALAPGDRVNAFHMTARFVLTCAVFFIVVVAAGTASGRRVLMTAAGVSGVAVAAIVVLEYLDVPWITGWLRIFRTNAAVVGGQLRASGPLQYPTIASMVLEIAFALTLGLLPSAVNEKRAGVVLAVVAALALIAEGVVLTFTRSGLVTLAASLALVGGTWAMRRGVDRVVLAVAVVGAIVCAEVAFVRSLELVKVRFTTEGQEYWFRAAVDAPATLTLRTGDLVRVPLRVKNTGRVAWSPDAEHPFLFSYHWLELDGNRVLEWEGERTVFPGAVTSGATVALEARVRAPSAPGSYLLQWDVEQQNQLWFSTEPDAVASITRTTVAGPVVNGPPIIRGGFLPRSASRPGRFVLWSAAFRMLKDHPWTGVGPDNFRLRYGQYLGTVADPRVHSNNMYLELLTGAGAIGAAAWLWFSWRAARAFIAAWATGAGPYLGIAAAGLAIAIHGLADSFLSFTVTYVLFALCLGLAASTAKDGVHAHRV